ncbi:nucleotidyltransferase domain-containing protein [Candidatus Woesearchaeota archaeon]|nr:nucleotidyltransferase domain-containing protein [Candidatus Woesearchaeota archaeon]
MSQKWNNEDCEIILRLIRGEIHLRELSKEIGIPSSTLSRKLYSLRQKLVIDYKSEGKNNVYFIKKNLISQKLVIMAENYKFIKTLTKYSILMPLLQDVVKKSEPNMVILFGSYAKGLSKEDSDIDIYINTKDVKLKKKIEQISDLISVKIGLFNPEDLLIKEIIKNHVIIRGAEEYYDKIKFFE